MSEKPHNDPIIYRAYGTVRGTYKPSKTDPTTGTLTTDDGVKFPAIVSYEVATLLEHQPQQFFGLALWKCYFKTRPASLELKKVETSNVENPRQHSFRADKFQVDGRLVKVNKESVTVEIKSNTRESESFTLTLKGTFSGDKAWPFWRFKLLRESKSYVIQSATKLPLPRIEKAPPAPPPPKKEKKAAPVSPPPPQQKKKKKEHLNTPVSPPSLFKKKVKISTPPESPPTPPPTEAEPKKRVFNLVDKLNK
ncbi:hypothetical protein [Gloeothece verrucosa]|uniref:Uncharacterized protein n=1 Tax=Gloeothece verrucosa (strain PCC 7822) TaxID=497965 RepID=E0UNK1_GLOV7|nr:hypothetical protein [Gloeothece verrucosa]ADN18531.1 hypothetical protein Cyan7822_6887 [Gloeothece verrucosa PCC 7822]